MSHSETFRGIFRNDLPRNQEGHAVIGDHRNDENLIVAQTHLSFLKFHNTVIDLLAGEGVPEEDQFNEARMLVTWHYQWMVLHDFLGRLTMTGIVDKILHDGRKFYRFKKHPYMPVEFSGAAYRLGHSMVRQTYDYNRVFLKVRASISCSSSLAFPARSSANSPRNPPTAPLPVSALPSNWIIDWRRFHEVDAGRKPQSSRRIDPLLASELHQLPGGGGNLAFRNLKRGINLGLPSGQMIASVMHIPNPLTSDEIASGPDGAAAKKHNLHTQTPLWYYILKEAAIRCNGERLGPVGSTIVSEVLVGLVHGDQQSYLWQKGPGWRPTLPSKNPGRFHNGGSPASRERRQSNRRLTLRDEKNAAGIPPAAF
ncbi:heme peroxidase family protein [Roseibium salinum]|nr:heme peroxidase family protein [Roseibium salinum]